MVVHALERARELFPISLHGVDLDNDGLYKPGADLVVELLNMAGTLDLGDFILT